MIIHTKNSTYELDQIFKRIRLVSSERPAHHRFEPVGEWRTYDSVSEVVLGCPLFLSWETGEPTQTSYVVDVE